MHSAEGQSIKDEANIEFGALVCAEVVSEEKSDVIFVYFVDSAFEPGAVRVDFFGWFMMTDMNKISDEDRGTILGQSFD